MIELAAPVNAGVFADLRTEHTIDGQAKTVRRNNCGELGQEINPGHPPGVYCGDEPVRYDMPHQARQKVLQC